MLIPKIWYNITCSSLVHKGGMVSTFPKGGGAMEVKDALTLMLMFGMFILALLTYLKKK